MLLSLITMVDIVLEWYRTQQMIYYGGRLSAIQRVSYHTGMAFPRVCSRPSALHHLYRWSLQYNRQPWIPSTPLCRRHPKLECSSRRRVIGDRTTLMHCIADVATWFRVNRRRLNSPGWTVGVETAG